MRMFMNLWILHPYHRQQRVRFVLYRRLLLGSFLFSAMSSGGIAVPFNNVKYYRGYAVSPANSMASVGFFRYCDIHTWCTGNAIPINSHLSFVTRK